MFVRLELILVLLPSFANAGPFCFRCNNIPLPRDCEYIVQCGDHESCHLEQLITANGVIVYNSGCLSNTRCSLPSTSIIGRRDATEIQTCSECCNDGDYCNNKGCSNAGIPPASRGFYCFSCNAMLDPTHCDRVSVCKQNERCLLQYNHAFDGLPDLIYKSGCAGEIACEVLENTAITNDGSKCPPSCCSGDFCNGQCLVKNESTSGHSSGHGGPTTSHTGHGDLTTIVPQMPTASVLGSQCNSHGGYQFLPAGPGDGLCVKFHTTHARSWYIALDTCHKEHADLVVIDTEARMEAVLKMVLEKFTGRTKPGDIWIGAFDTYNNRTFYWPNYQRMVPGYSNWGTSQPDINQLTDERCVFMSHVVSFEWFDAPCSESNIMFICEKRSDLGLSIPVGSTPAPKICAEIYGYTPVRVDHLHFGICIKVYHDVSELLSWQEARKVCQRDGADLVAIDTEEKEKGVVHYIHSHQHSSSLLHANYWIGAYDRDGSDVWYWSAGWRLDYGAWAQGQPEYHVGGVNKDCVMMNELDRHLWHDDDCARKHNFICEKR